MTMTDDDIGADPDAGLVRPDYTELSLDQMLTRIQRGHIENLLALVESGEVPNAQVLAQINRFLADNGFTLNGDMPTVDARARPTNPQLPAPPKDRPALPDFSGERFDE